MHTRMLSKTLETKNLLVTRGQVSSLSVMYMLI